MTKYQRKQELLRVNDRCPECGCRMVALRENPKYSYPSHAAMLVGVSRLICYQCYRLECKKREFEKLPKSIQWRIKFDELTGILTLLKRIRGKINKFWYLKVLGNNPNGKP